MRILTFSNLFPNPEQPERGNFVVQMIEALPSQVKHYVVSPLPWFPPFPGGTSDRSIFARIPYNLHENGLKIFYPKYLMVPKVSGMLHPLTVAIGCYPLVKRLVRTHSIDLIHSHWIFPDSVAAAWIAKRLCKPVVVTARGCDINLYGKYKTRRPQILWALRNADAITTVSDSLRSKIVDDFGIDGSKVSTIRNGINNERFRKIDKSQARSLLGLEKTRKYLLFVGQLHGVKGLAYLISALKQLGDRGSLDFKTILVGEGPQRKRIEKQIAQLRLQDYVELVGERAYEEIPKWMNACDVFCLPSVREGTPNVVLEAQACQMPVVASNVGGIPEVINKRNGILVPPRNSTALAHALDISFRSNNNAHGNSVTYTWKDCADNYLDLYQHLLVKRK